MIQNLVQTKSSFSDVWALRAGKADPLIIDYINITSWPRQSEDKWDSRARAKAHWIRSGTAHFLFVGEHHTMGAAEEAMVRYLSSAKVWTFFSASACESTNSTKGNFGGVLGCARSYLSLTPPAMGHRCSSHWSIGETAWLTGAYTRLCGQDVLIAGGYVKDGPLS